MLQQFFHIHVQREKMIAKFWLDPVVLQHIGGFGRNELNTIAKLVNENQQFFMEKWNEFFSR